MKKLKKTKFFIFGKKSHSAEKKVKGGTLWDFPTSILSQNSKQIEGGTLWGKNFPEKKSQCRKKLVWYAGKQEKPFWFSSLDQTVQFGAIIFCRTFKNYFGQFVWIEKSHYNSRVSLHEAPTKNRKTQIGSRDVLKLCN